MLSRAAILTCSVVFDALKVGLSLLSTVLRQYIIRQVEKLWIAGSNSKENGF